MNVHVYAVDLAMSYIIKGVYTGF